MMDLDAYSLFAENKKSLKETSMDDSDVSNIRYMTQSMMEVIDFDQVKRQYINALGMTEESASSVDAIIPFKDCISFVEFKNGKVNNRNIKDKARDSLLVFMDITKKNISYTRDRVEFIVVYNLDKNPLPNQIKKELVQESPSRIAIGDYFSAKGKRELVLFDLERYEGLYFSKVHTYSAEAFEKYLNDREL